MFGNAFSFVFALVTFAAVAVTVEPRVGVWAGERLDAWRVEKIEPAPVSVTPRPEPAFTAPIVDASLRFPAPGEGPLTAAEACVAVWLAVDGLGEVAPQGGGPLPTLSTANGRFGCVGVSKVAGPVFVVAEPMARDVWSSAAWRVDAVCDERNGLLAGNARNLCAFSPLT